MSTASLPPEGKKTLAPTFTVTGDLTFAHVMQQRAVGLTALAAGTHSISLAAVQNIDSAGLSVLLEWQRVAQKNGIGLSFSDDPATLQSLAKVYGVEALLGL